MDQRDGSDDVTAQRAEDERGVVRGNRDRVTEPLRGLGGRRGG